MPSGEQGERPLGLSGMSGRRLRDATLLW
jgi:hypothetical protein